MKFKLQTTTLALLGSAGTAFAASGGESESISLAAILFLGFLGLIIAFQLYPAVMLLVSMIKGIFSRTPQTSQRKASEKSP